MARKKRCDKLNEARTVKITKISIITAFNNLHEKLLKLIDSTDMELVLINSGDELQVDFYAAKMQPDWNSVSMVTYRPTCENPGHGSLLALVKLKIQETHAIDAEDLQFLVFSALVKELRQYITTQELWLGKDAGDAPTALDKLFPHARERKYSVRKLLQDDHNMWIQVVSEQRAPTKPDDTECVSAEDKPGKQPTLVVGCVPEDMQCDPALMVEMPEPIPGYVHPRTDKYGVIHYGLCDHMCTHDNARPIVG